MIHLLVHQILPMASNKRLSAFLTCVNLRVIKTIFPDFNPLELLNSANCCLEALKPCHSTYASQITARMETFLCSNIRLSYSQLTPKTSQASSSTSDYCHVQKTNGAMKILASCSLSTMPAGFSNCATKNVGTTESWRPGKSHCMA